jgi:hypothetical protein
MSDPQSAPAPAPLPGLNQFVFLEMLFSVIRFKLIYVCLEFKPVKIWLY